MATEKKIPMRQCLGCRVMKPKKELLRLVHTPDGSILFDERGKVSGRGAYVCRAPECLKKALKTGAFDRAFGIHIPDEIQAELTRQMEATHE